MSDRDFWLMRQDAKMLDRRLTAFEEATDLGIVNSSEVDNALTELLYSRSMAITGDPVIPRGSPHPIISLPADFAPDYFELEQMIFVSQRFRDALRQLPDVVQYWPVELTEASEAARQQDYLLMRVLAWQPAMDLNRSAFKKEETTNRRTGEQFTNVLWVDRFVLLTGLVAQTEIFRAAEHYESVLVTDALAERVMKAGCEGVSFEDPQTCGMVNREPRRVRTADGVVVEDADLAEWAAAHR